MDPAVPDGAAIEVRGGSAPRPGDLALCARDGWGDVLRLMAVDGRGRWRATLDAYPRRAFLVDASAVLGIVGRVDGREPARLAGFIACRAGLGALGLAIRRVAAAPAWDGRATDTVLAKYALQAGEYHAARRSNLAPEHCDLLASRVPAGGSILVAGCGVGSEAIHLARLGYRVAGFDALPVMIEAARGIARAAGVEARFAVADARRGRWPPGPYDAIYMTPLLYSFVFGSAVRIAFLRRLGQSLRGGGPVLFSVRRHPGFRSWLETRIAWCRRGHDGGSVVGEPGDWYTRYLAPDGGIGTSYLHRFTAEEVVFEARAAGFGTIECRRADFVAGRFVTPS
jgi:SAM-dependent methyltransferase